MLTVSVCTSVFYDHQGTEILQTDQFSINTAAVGSINVRWII